jgi:hypothetical protein
MGNTCLTFGELLGLVPVRLCGELRKPSATPRSEQGRNATIKLK